MNIAHEAFINGVSTCRIKLPAKNLGIDSISRSQVSAITKELNSQTVKKLVILKSTAASSMLMSSSGAEEKSKNRQSKHLKTTIKLLISLQSQETTILNSLNNNARIINLC